MPIRHLYVARHGAADVFGRLTDEGRRQAAALGARLRELPIDAIWHSPVPRAVDTARVLGAALPAVPVAAAEELTDNVPYVPGRSDMPAAWSGFFDGYDPAETAAGARLAAALIGRFAGAPSGDDRHEVLVTHDYPIAWLVRDALGAPPAAWMRLTSANAALTVLTYGSQQPPSLMMFNDMSHLDQNLRWTGFPTRNRP